jgi:hypothetical protein
MTEQNTSKGVLLTILPDGKVTHQFFGVVSEVECMGLGQYLQNIPERHANGRFLSAIGEMAKSVRNLAELVLKEKEEGCECCQESSSDSSHSSDSLPSSTKPPDPSSGS